MRISSLIASEPVRSTNGAVSYQPGATPQLNVHPSQPGLKARPIAGGCGSERGLAPQGWDGPSALHFVVPIIPGALPQAGMGAHLWCWERGPARQSEPTIAGLLLSRWERTEVRVHRTAKITKVPKARTVHREVEDTFTQRFQPFVQKYKSSRRAGLIQSSA
jgi:hypothetical protein